jgi:hypothetical protein
MVAMPVTLFCECNYQSFVMLRMNSNLPKHALLISIITLLAGCGGGGGSDNNTDELDDDQDGANTIVSELIGTWQNTQVPENFWVITADSITNYGNFPPQPCLRQDATILSPTTFTIEVGDGAGSQFTMRIENEQLILEAPQIFARHDSISETALPSRCVDDSEVTQDNTDPLTSRYTDSFLQLDYPEDWTLDLNPGFGVSARFQAPETTQLGGNASCGVSSSLQPGSSLAEQTENTRNLFNPALVSETTLLTINGTQASRFVVNANPVSRWQLAYADEYFHLVDCSGISEEEATRLFESVLVF